MGCLHAKAGIAALTKFNAAIPVFCFIMILQDFIIFFFSKLLLYSVLLQFYLSSIFNKHLYSTLAIAAFLSICTAMGTPAIPVAGTTMVYVVMTGLGMSSELCMIGYSLVLAMNYLPGMAVITLNVIGDAATNVIVSFKEKVLNKDVYYK